MPCPREALQGLPVDARATASQLPQIVGLSIEELRVLVNSNAFPAPKYDKNGETWNKKKIIAWSWGLRNSHIIACRVEAELGYRKFDWAQPVETKI